MDKTEIMLDAASLGRWVQKMYRAENTRLLFKSCVKARRIDDRKLIRMHINTDQPAKLEAVDSAKL
jgi:hypothetical protein